MQDTSFKDGPMNQIVRAYCKKSPRQTWEHLKLGTLGSSGLVLRSLEGGIYIALALVNLSEVPKSSLAVPGIFKRYLLHCSVITLILIHRIILISETCSKCLHIRSPPNLPTKDEISRTRAIAYPKHEMDLPELP